MALKDRIKRDNQRVFMNENHFAEQHVLNGHSFTCMLDDTQTQHDHKNNTRDMIIYVTDENLPIKIHPGQEVIFDAMLMYVTGVTDGIGLKAVYLSSQEPFAMQLQDY